MVTRKAYSDAYYGDFFDYTRKKLGKDRLIMSRPVDGYDKMFNENILMVFLYNYYHNISENKALQKSFS